MSSRASEECGTFECARLQLVSIKYILIAEYVLHSQVCGGPTDSTDALRVQQCTDSNETHMLPVEFDSSTRDSHLRFERSLNMNGL